MTVTSPRGFRAAGVTAGLKPSGQPDLALVVNDGPQHAVAAVYTSNRCKANPVLFSQKVTAGGGARAVVLNSGGANCFTGQFGYETTELTAAEVAAGLTATGNEPVTASDIVVCSTGLIGVGDQTWRDTLLGGITPAIDALSTSGGEDAARAIMTTDTVPKNVEVSVGDCTIGGIAKGAGMLAPALATMLVVLTTDAQLTPEELDSALRHATARSFDRLDSDACMSTNDTVVLMSSGASGVHPDLDAFTQALTETCQNLARQLMSDAEGAAHNIAITTSGAASEADAVEVSRAVSRSNLFKTAIFGEDPNWGRIVAQVGTTSAQFDPANIDVTVNGVPVCVASGPHADPQSVVFTRDVTVDINLNTGDHQATVWTNDLTHQYVEENSAYSS